MENMHQYVVRNLQRTKGSWTKIAKEVGMSPRTVMKIGNGLSSKPWVTHVQVLADYFKSFSDSSPR